MSSPEFIVTDHETIYNYGNTPTIWSVRDGDWGDPRTWTTGVSESDRIPEDGDHVEVNHIVNIGTDSTTIPQTGTLASIVVNNTNIVPGEPTVGGSMPLGGGIVNTYNSAGLLPTEFTMQVRTFYVLSRGSVDFRRNFTISLGGGAYNTLDQGLHGNGFIVLGDIKLRGRGKTTQPVRLAAELAAGATTITLRERVSGWEVGDKLLVAGFTRAYTNYIDGPEIVTIASVAASGLSVTIDAPGTVNQHRGATGGRNGNVVLERLSLRRGLPNQDRVVPWLHTAVTAGDNSTNVIDFLPHVVNITRSGIVKSLSTASTANRAHGFYTASARGSFTNTAFQNMGRTTCAVLDDTTNHIGRYPMHFHRLDPTQSIKDNFGSASSTFILGEVRPIRFSCIGNVILDDVTTQGTNVIKWGLTVHGSQGVLLKWNTVYNWGGANVVLEDGSTSNNFLIENFSCVSHNAPNFGRDWGNEGCAYDIWSPANYFYRNIGCHSEYVDFQIPENDPGGYQQGPILLFEQNESYHSRKSQEFWTVVGGTVKDFTCWNINQGIADVNYPCDLITYDGLVGREQGTVAIGSTGWNGGDYDTVRAHFTNCDIQGFDYAIEVPMKLASNSFDNREGGGGNDYSAKTLTIENSYFRANVAEIFWRTPHGAGTGGPASCVPRTVTLRNIRYGTSVSGGTILSGHAVILTETLTDGGQNLLNLDRLIVENHNRALISGSPGIPVGENYRVFFRNQASSGILHYFDPVLHSGTVPLWGAPVSGLTNSVLASNWVFRMDEANRDIQWWNITSGLAEPTAIRPYRQGIPEALERSGTFWKGVARGGEIATSGVFDGMLSGFNIDGLIIVA